MEAYVVGFSKAKVFYFFACLFVVFLCLLIIFYGFWTVFLRVTKDASNVVNKVYSERIKETEMMSTERDQI